jgi:hypothetical protein
MRVFRDKNSGELFLQFNDKLDMVLSLYDGREYDKYNFILEEIPTKNKEYSIERTVSKCYARDLQKYNFKLKDVISIPVDSKKIPFRVEHITDEKAYLVSVYAIDELTMQNMNEYLDNFLNKLPKDLVNILAEIEHKRNGELVRKSKVTLVSRGNLMESNECDGEDDIVFDGFKDEKSRCRSYNEVGITTWWWTDSTSIFYSDNHIYIDGNGELSNNGYKDNSNGVCPCIAISRK